MQTKTERNWVFWIMLIARVLWYTGLIFLIFVLFQGPEKGFRYLGL